MSSGQSDRDWEEWGKSDPYFAVLSLPKFHKDQIKNHRQEFWNRGEIEVEEIIQNYEQAFGSLPRGRALDFGCGVGRLTLPLSLRFDEVISVDVSPSMLAELRRNMEQANRSNIQPEESDDDLTRVTGTFDLVVSVIVLQHIPVRRGMMLLERLIEKVRAGGGCHLHVSVRREVGTFRQVAYWIRDHIVLARPIMNLIAGLPLGRPGMQMNAYPISSILSLFHKAGMDQLRLTLSDHGEVLTATFTAKKR